jgi:hypothetical protein
MAGVTFFAAVLTLAQRAFWAAAILARAPALKMRFFVLFADELAAAALFPVDSTTALGTVFLTASLDLAQRAF